VATLDATDQKTPKTLHFVANVASGAKSMTDLRCGLIGYGAWGQHHARAIRAVEGAKLVAIAGRSQQSVDKARVEQPDAAIYSDYRQMLASERLEMCSIVLPSHLHFEATKAVLESGCHVLLEKPMALNLDDCSRMEQLAKERGLVLAIGHELRLSSLWGKVKQLIDAGSIGEPIYGLIELWRRPYRLGADGWRYDISRVGSWILEEPIHFFDLARWYFAGVGEPISVTAAASGKRSDHPELNDNFSAIVRFPKGRYTVISQTLAGWEHHQTVKITGTHGALWATWSGAMDRTFEPTFSLKMLRGEQVETVPVERPSGEVYELVDEVAAVISSIRNGTPPPCTAHDGWWSAAMCLKAEQSLKTGQADSFAQG
jgi:myo-inositol 2-dehydrogenase/D-chiro-inositol 1-dehydrogenase